jgi:hypothetical protein
MIDDVYLVEPRETFTDLEWNGFGYNQEITYQMIGGKDTW